MQILIKSIISYGSSLLSTFKSEYSLENGGSILTNRHHRHASMAFISFVEIARRGSIFKFLPSRYGSRGKNLRIGLQIAIRV